MRWLLRLACQPAAHVLVFCLGALLFGWPLVSIPFDSGVGYLTFYLFGAWAVFIVVLGVLPRCRDEGETATVTTGESRVED
jgi:hypothetical protein